jgi:hypothetical protein
MSLKEFLATCVLITLFGLLSCSDEPNPNTGLDISRDQLVNVWAVDRLVYLSEDITEEFAGVRLNFRESGLLIMSRAGKDFDEVWDLKNSTLFINVDQIEDTVLRKLNGTYVASDTSATSLRFINQNPRTPGEMLLVLP